MHVTWQEGGCGFICNRVGILDRVEVNMAKSLRSKSKRANRSLLRSQLTIPMVQKSQEELCQRLEKDLAKSNGAAIKRLREKLANKRKEKGEPVDTRTHQKYAMDSENPEDAKKATKPVQLQLVTVRKPSFSHAEALAADKQQQKKK